MCSASLRFGAWSLEFGVRSLGFVILKYLAHMKKMSLLLLTCVVILLSGCRESMQKSITTTDLVFTKEGELHLIKSISNDTIQSLDIEIADTDYDIQTGLMYRNSMQENQGMLFLFPEEATLSFYMKNTKIPLDIIYINKEHQIVDFKENTTPLSEESLPTAVPARYVLEINAGLSEKWGLDIGDRVVWE